MSKNNNVEVGEVIEAYPNTSFLVKRPEGKELRGYLSGRLKKNFIHVVVGDRVEIEIPEIGEIGRIIRRK